MDPRHAAATALAALLALAAHGCADECTSSGDCIATEQCTDGTCVPRAPLPPPPPPIDGGPRDAAAVPDSGVVGDDGGGAGDGGVADGSAGDGAVIDGGPSGGDGGMAGDGGTGTSTSSTLALLEAVQLDGAGPNRINRIRGAFFVHPQPATVASFAGPHGPCSLVDWQATRAQAVGLRGTGMAASGFRDVFMAGGRFVLSQSSLGIFEAPGAATVPFLWVNASYAITYSIDASSAVGQLTTATATLAAAGTPFVSLSPAPGTGLMLGTAPLEFSWMPSTGNPRVVVEVGRADRALVLRCEGADTGALIIPGSAIGAYVAAAPAGASTIELGYEVSGTMRIPRVGGGVVPTLLRHLRGVRYEAR